MTTRFGMGDRVQTSEGTGTVIGPERCIRATNGESRHLIISMDSGDVSSEYAKNTIHVKEEIPPFKKGDTVKYRDHPVQGVVDSVDYTPKGLHVTIIARYGTRITAPPGDFTLVEKSDTLSLKDYITYKSSTCVMHGEGSADQSDEEEDDMTFKTGDRVKVNNGDPTLSGKLGYVSYIPNIPTGYATVVVDGCVTPVTAKLSHLELLGYEGFNEGDYVVNTNESDSLFYGRKGTIVGFGDLYSEEEGRSVIVRTDDNGGEVTMMDSEIMKANKESQFDNGDRVALYFNDAWSYGEVYNVMVNELGEVRLAVNTDDRGLVVTEETGVRNLSKESRFEEGQEVVVSDPEMRCYGEHGIVESVQVMEEFGSSPVLLVKLLDPVEYLVYGEECFQSLGDFYEHEEKEDEGMIGLGDTVVLDMADHEHAGKRGKVMNVGYFDEDGVEHVQVVLFYDGQVVIEPRDAFTLITEDELVHEDQMLMSLQDPNEVYSMLEETDEHVEGKLFDELAGALEGLIEQEKSKRKGEPSLEEQGIKSLIEITYNDETRVHTLSEYEANGLRAKLLESFSDGGSILIGEIVTKVGDIKHVRISDVEEN